MGFFSKIKKFWSGDDTVPAEKEAAKPAVEETEDVSPAAVEEPEEQERSEEEAASKERAADASPAAGTPERSPEEAAQPAEESVTAAAERITDADAAPEREPEPVVEPDVAEPVVPATESVPEPEQVAQVAEPAISEPVEPEVSVAASSIDEGVASVPAVADDQQQWQKELTVALRGAEPRLSVWLEHVLEGIDEVGDPLWERLRFFFDALDAPKDEAESFIAKFADWLDEMEYDYVSDFRSELQYRLALALDLEDEEDERSRLFLKLSEGLSKTKAQITKQIDGLLASHSQIDESFWEEFEEILIMSDVGFEPTVKLVERLRERVRKAGTSDPAKFKEFMREELEEIFKTRPRITAVNMPEVVLMVGVNGVGKTTTIAKLAYRAQLQGKKVLIAAGDTFRAAAIEQLQVWADRIGVDFHAKAANSDPAAVAYEAVEKAVEGGYDLLFVDTAGRLQTKVGLMDELQKIRNVLGKKHEGAPHRTILTIDATTGQNALSQTKLFNEVAELDEIILTKLDGTAKGGIVVAIAMEFDIPITYIGLGEKMEDLRPFNGADFATALLGLDDENNAEQ